MKIKGMTVDDKQRPLVTFALVAYNQEQFIREALEAVFSQTYSPLEIILSDDCSTDRTFEIMEEMVEGYNGEHCVVSVQTPQNIGVFAHVMRVANLAKGGLVVLAAGDDISKPERTAELTAAWESTGAWGFHSRYDRINDDGELLAESQFSSALQRPDYQLRKYFFADDGPIGIVHGSSSAYDKRVFHYLKGFENAFILGEDGMLSLVLNLFEKKVRFVDTSLVAYREHIGSLTNARGKDARLSGAGIAAAIEKSAVYALSCANRANLLMTLADTYSQNNPRPINRSVIDNDIRLLKLQADWHKVGFMKRARVIMLCRSVKDIKWIALRLFGVQFYTRCKLCVNVFKSHQE